MDQICGPKCGNPIFWRNIGTWSSMNILYVYMHMYVYLYIYIYVLDMILQYISIYIYIPSSHIISISKQTFRISPDTWRYQAYLGSLHGQKSHQKSSNLTDLGGDRIVVYGPPETWKVPFLLGKSKSPGMYEMLITFHQPPKFSKKCQAFWGCGKLSLTKPLEIRLLEATK